MENEIFSMVMLALRSVHTLGSIVESEEDRERMYCAGLDLMAAVDLSRWPEQCQGSLHGRAASAYKYVTETREGYSLARTNALKDLIRLMDATKPEVALAA